MKNYCPNIGMKTTFMNTETSKTNEPHKFVLNLSQRLDLRNSNKDVALQNLSIFYTWKNIRKQYKNDKLKIIVSTWNNESKLPDGSYSLSNIRKKYKNNKLKLIASTWNDEFELPDGSYSFLDIQDFIEYIIKKHETLTTFLLFMFVSIELIIG